MAPKSKYKHLRKQWEYGVDLSPKEIVKKFFNIKKKISKPASDKTYSNEASKDHTSGLVTKGRKKILKFKFSRFQSHKMSNLKEHVRSHTAIRPYPCRQCFKNYSSARNRDVHEKRQDCKPIRSKIPDNLVKKIFLIERADSTQRHVQNWFTLASRTKVIIVK